MKKTTFPRIYRLAVLLITLILLPSLNFAQNKSICDVYKSNGGGYSTTLTSVVCNQSDHSHTIILRVEHNGCDGLSCPAISRFCVQAAAGTYSNIVVNILYGGMTFTGINSGPVLPGDPWTGFRIEGISGIGNGNAGVFTISYKLTGSFQDQQVSARAGALLQLASFNAADFQNVMTCYNTDCTGGGLTGPTANNDNATTPQNTPVTLNVLANDVAGSGALVPSSVAFIAGTQPNPATVGTFTVNHVTGAVTFTPVASYTGLASIQYQVCDVNSLCSTATITINITASLLPPTAINDNATTTVNTPVNINILANDIPGSGALVPASVTFIPGTAPPVSKGVFTKNLLGVVTFTPATGYTGIATIQYTVCDVNSLCSSATITVTINAGGSDTDGDGCPDNVDDYPNDPTRCFDNYFPAAGNGTLAYEDLWPSKGDYDFNDVVLDYRFKTVTNSSNKVVEIFATFILKASGAEFHNGFGFQLPTNNVDPSTMTVTGSHLLHSIVSLNSHGLENGQTKPTIIVFDDFFDLMPNPGCGIGVNTTPGCAYVNPVTISLHITFSSPLYTMTQTNVENFNPFIFVGLDRRHEVHLPDYVPTSLANPGFFGTYDDRTSVPDNRYYKTVNNLPWAINLYESFSYPKEIVDIIITYNHFVEWATSGGLLYQDWYMDKPGYRNVPNIYVH
ncbi:MAG: LruC domain-containing protein [Bacteroidetes bacterium]|nr:LruC domain-containing protein [Bacteroidota bacterium]